MVVLRARGRSNFGVVAVHAVDRRNVASEYARGVFADLMRLDIESFWKPQWPLIVLGEFNADPHDHELSSCLGLFALRELALALCGHADGKIHLSGVVMAPDE